MYNLPYFKTDDQEELIRFMRDHSFVTLTGVDADNQPVATQLPVFIDEKDGKYFLSGHIMKKSDHQLAFATNPQVLAIFTGPHAYVSATWYVNPHMGSTWNYMSVHAKGVIRFSEEEDAIAAALRRLSLHYENNNTASATYFDNLPADYVSKMTKGILAFEIEVTGIDHVFKLSQNRDPKSFEEIIRRLHEKGGDASLVAAEMEKRKSKLYPS